MFIVLEQHCLCKRFPSIYTRQPCSQLILKIATDRKRNDGRITERCDGAKVLFPASYYSLLFRLAQLTNETTASKYAIAATFVEGFPPRST